jgi:hypothetical protein
MADAPRLMTHRSPPLALLAIVFTVLTLGTTLADTPTLIAFLQFAASIVLGLFTATVVSRLLFHGINVAGVHIALVGGVSASVFLGCSSLAMWTFDQAVVTDADVLRVTSLFGHATGTFGHTAAIGLLIAGVSVPELAFGLVPAWIGWLGLATAAVAELSAAALVVPAAEILVPVARYPALVWLIATGLTLPTRQIGASDSTIRFPSERRRAGWDRRRTVEIRVERGNSHERTG